MQKSIFLTGLLSARIGGLEVGNLGNFAIIDPFLDHLKNEFPEHAIRTSFQLTEPYEKSKLIHCLRDERFWNYGKYTAKSTIQDLFRFIWHKLSGSKSVLKKSLLLSEIDRSDFVIDFSGDVFGENAKYNVFLEGAAKMFFSLMLKKKVFVLASSPGPFENWYKRAIVKYLYRKAEVILNREPISTDILRQLGLPATKVNTSACPSYLFSGNEPETERKLLRSIGVNDDDKVIGFVITGWTMPKGPYNKFPREEEELKVFIDYLQYLHEHCDAKIVLMSHGNSTDAQGEMSYGNDFYISQQIHEMIPQVNRERILLLDTLMDARRSKAVIGNFDMLVSGRLHAAIAGISQAVPTLLYDYGHEPKAHKLRGFLRLINYEKYLCPPDDLELMKAKGMDLWENLDSTKAYLKVEVEAVKSKSLTNFTSIKNYL